MILVAENHCSQMLGNVEMSWRFAGLCVKSPPRHHPTLVSNWHLAFILKVSGARVAEVSCVKDEWLLGFISVVTLTWAYKKCPALLEQLMILMEEELVVGG